MSGTITVEHEGGDRFAASVRQHRVVVDQPLAEGGGDGGPTPTELFVTSLVTCVAFYVRRFLVRHGFNEEGLSVSASYEMATRPARVGSVALTVALPAGVPEERREALVAVATHCTVHNTLADPPEVSVVLATDDVAATAEMPAPRGSVEGAR